MNHLTSLQISMYADAALSANDIASVSQHLASCAHCQAQVAQAEREKQMLTEAMNNDPLDALPELIIPEFTRPTGLRDFALANIAAGLVIWLAGFLWKTLFGELAVNVASWATSTYLPDIYEITSATALYYLKEGTAMFDAYLGFIVLSFSLISAFGLLLMYRKHKTSVGLCLVVFMGVTLVAPAPVSALELRLDEEGVLTIPADETIDDTLIIAAERVVIKGKVTGDLMAFGRRVDIEGVVDGNVMAFGEAVKVSGAVGGLVMGAASTFDLSGAAVGGNFWAAGAKLNVDSESRIASNSALAGENVSVAGFVSRDLYAFGESIELSGELGEDLEAFGNRVRLLDGAHVRGDARLRVNREDSLYREDAARIDGAVEFLDLPEELEKTSRYTSVEFYLWQLARLVSAVLVGLALVWLIPGLRRVAIGGGFEGLKLAGIGLLTLVSVPIMAVIVAVTLVGLPFSIIGVIAWIVAIYLAKIFIALFIGRMVLDGTAYRDKMALVLLAGMSIVLVVVNLPAIGGIISFLLTLVGLGLIVKRLFAGLPMRHPELSA
ncbi:MAG: hypothetical protein ACFHXK_06595 [bacterium]